MNTYTGVCLGRQSPKESGVRMVENDWLDIFADRVRTLRERQRRSRKVVSELCGLSPDAVRRYERKEARPTADAILAIADYFEVSVDFLVGRENFENSP